MIHPMWAGQPALARSLEEVQALLLARTQIRDRAVNALVQGEVAAGGKMLRAALTLRFAELAAADHRTAVHAAAAIEALHLATLIHDDVLDRAPRRRGVATVQTAATNKAAVYAGDLLFSVYFELLAAVAPGGALVGVNAAAMRRVFMGELDQNGPARAEVGSVSAYIQEATGKTAALIGLACRMGVAVGAAPAGLATVAQRFGEHLGLAFQITDDLLDFRPQTGKPALADLRTGALSLPLVFTQTAVPEQFAALMAESEAPAARAALLDLVVAHGIGPSVALQAELMAKLEADRLALPDGAVRVWLGGLCEQLLHRTD